MGGIVGAGVVPVQEHAPGLDPVLHADSKTSFMMSRHCCVTVMVLFFHWFHSFVFHFLSVTTTGAVAQGPTAHVRILVPTVTVHRLGDIRLHPFFPT